MPDETVYPPHVLRALDSLLDTLTPSERLTVEDDVMSFLHRYARNPRQSDLLGVAGRYPALKEALLTLARAV